MWQLCLHTFYFQCIKFTHKKILTLYAEQKKKKTQSYRTVFLTLWEKARVGCFKRTALKHVYYLG